MTVKRFLEVQPEDYELLRAALAEAADTRAAVAELAASELEAERRTNPRQDLRPGYGRVARLLAQAAALRALARSELVAADAVGDGDPDASAVHPAPSPSTPGDASADYDGAGPRGEAADLPVNLDPTPDAGGSPGATIAPPETSPPPVAEPAAAAVSEPVTARAPRPTDAPDDGQEADRPMNPRAGGTRDVQLDEEGHVVAVSGRQAARQALARALSPGHAREHVPGQVYALSPATLDLIARIEGDGVNDPEDTRSDGLATKVDGLVERGELELPVGAE